MDNRAFDKTKLPSRHVTERTSRALLRSYFHAMRLRGEHIHLMRQTRAFKRGVAAGVTVTGGTVNENLSKVVSNGDYDLQKGVRNPQKEKKIGNSVKLIWVPVR
jgi:dihydroxy-acid dehydratase